MNDKTIEQLQQEVVILNEKNITLGNDVARERVAKEDLATELSLVKSTNDDLVKTNEDLLDISKGAKQENEVLAKVNEELTLQVEELSSGTIAVVKTTAPADLRKAGFSRNGKNYSFNFPSMIPKGYTAKVTIADVVADEALQDKLISDNSKMISEEA
jgi:hypothetical protein